MVIGAKMNMIIEREVYVKAVEGERMICEMEHMWKDKDLVMKCHLWL